MRRFLRGVCLPLAAGFSISSVSAQDTAPPDALADITDSAVAVETGETAPVDLFDKDSFRLRTIVCPFKGQVDYKPGEISCQYLEVPENREKARPRKIELHVVKIHARQPDDWDAEEKGEWVKRDDPIIYLTGGPGAKAQTYVERFKDHGVRDYRDLYVLEQRGIGWSGDFCPTYFLTDPAPGNSPDWDARQQAGLEAMESCFATAKARKVDLSGYSTIENARDVEALRRALGLEQWNVWGISYGSILGQAYLKQDPAGVRAAVIDAIVPLQQDISFFRIATYFDRVLNILQETCDADETCAAQFPDLQDRLEAAMKKTAMNPIEVDAIDTELFPSGKAWFFQDIIGGAPFSLFYEQDNYPTLPAFIDSFLKVFEEEDAERLRILTAGGGGGGPAGFQISQGMYNAIACNDNWAPAAKAAIEADFEEHPALAMIFGDPAIFDEQAAICKRYGADPRPAEDYLPLQTDIRTLIVEGQMDPITPPPLAEAILPGFSNGTYVEFAYAGHGPTRSVECAGEFLTAFFDDPDGELDMSCPDSMEAPSFAAPLFETGAFAKFGAMAAEDPKKMAVPAIWAGIPALVMLLAFPIYTLAPIARAINGGGAAGTGGARLIAWLTALAGAAAVGGIGAAAGLTAKENPFLLFLGTLDWGRWFAAAGFLAGPLGLLLLWLTVKARMRTVLPIGTLLGLVFTGIAGVGIASWLLAWGFSPF